MILKELGGKDVEALGEFVRKQEELLWIATLADEAVETLEERDDYHRFAINIALADGNEHEDLFVENLGKEFDPLLTRFFRELAMEARRIRLTKEIEITGEEDEIGRGDFHDEPADAYADSGIDRMCRRDGPCK